MGIGSNTPRARHEDGRRCNSGQRGLERGRVLLMAAVLGPHGMGMGDGATQAKDMGAGSPQGSGSRATVNGDGCSSRLGFSGWR